MSFLRAHGFACSFGHLLGAGLHATGHSVEPYLAAHLNPWLSDIGVSSSTWPRSAAWWPAEVDYPRWMVVVPILVFWLLTMPESRRIPLKSLRGLLGTRGSPSWGFLGR